MTIGTRLYTWFHGALVGSDEFGNRYYRARNGKSKHGREQRWVLFNGQREASKVPPEWHGWLHHTLATPPSDAPRRRFFWQKAHLPNLTGTIHVYRPNGYAKPEQRAASASDYQPWTPS